MAPGCHPGEVFWACPTLGWPENVLGSPQAGESGWGERCLGTLDCFPHDPVLDDQKNMDFDGLMDDSFVGVTIHFWPYSMVALRKDRWFWPSLDLPSTERCRGLRCLTHVRQEYTSEMPWAPEPQDAFYAPPKKKISTTKWAALKS